MAINSYDIEITQGDDYQIIFDFKDSDGVAIDMTGATAEAQIKLVPSSDVIVASFTLDVSNLATGRIIMSLPDETTTTMKVTKDDASNIYYYDLQVTYSGDIVKTEVGGTITILPQVTF
jgi:hypothetical protein